jgi:hypothetical protein
LRANAGWQTVAQLEASLARDDILRVTAYLELDFPEGREGAISCRSRIQPDGGLDPSSVTMKYLTQRVKRLPLRNEVVATARESGMRTLRLQVLCEDDGRAAPPMLVRGRTQMLLDHYQAVR